MKAIIGMICLAVLSACGSSGIKQKKYDQLLAENERLKQQIIELEEQQLEVQDVLNMMNGRKDCGVYCDYFGKELVYGYVNHEVFYEPNENLDAKIFGMYFEVGDNQNKHALLLYPNGTYVRVEYFADHQSMSLAEGTYTAKDGVLQMNGKVSSGGGENWSAYTVTSDGIIIDVYPPFYTAADQPKKLLFERVGANQIPE